MKHTPRTSFTERSEAPRAALRAQIQRLEKRAAKGRDKAEADRDDDTYDDQPTAARRPK